MKKLLGNFQKWMTAITFAEAGEWETARRMSPVTEPAREISPAAQIFMAAAFAEAGEHETAIAMTSPAGQPLPASDFLASLGLGGVRMTYGVFAVEAAR